MRKRFHERTLETVNAVRTTDPLPTTTPNLLSAVNLRLALLGLPTLQGVHDAEEDLVAPLLERQRELSRRLDDRLPPVDERIRPSSPTSSRAPTPSRGCRGAP